MENQKQDKKILIWFEDHRILSLMIFLLIIWFSIFVLLWMKADEVTKDPCSVCSKRHGKNVICTIGGTIPVNRIYYPNGSIFDEDVNIRYPTETFNFSGLIVGNLTTNPKT